MGLHEPGAAAGAGRKSAFHLGRRKRGLAQIVASANGGDEWVMGGGDLVGQFIDAGLLDEIRR